MYILYNRFYFIIEVVARLFYGRAIIFILSLFDVYPFCCRLFTSSPMAERRQKKRDFSSYSSEKQNKRNECGVYKTCHHKFCHWAPSAVPMRFERIRRNDLNVAGETFFFLFFCSFSCERESPWAIRGWCWPFFGYINSKLWLDNIITENQIK